MAKFQHVAYNQYIYLHIGYNRNVILGASRDV